MLFLFNMFYSFLIFVAKFFTYLVMLPLLVILASYTLDFFKKWYRFIWIHKGLLSAIAGSEVWTKQSGKKIVAWTSYL